MINEPSTGYWDYSSANDQTGPQWVDYGSPGANPAPGTTPTNAPVGAGGMPVGGANPILTTGTPGGYTPIGSQTAPQTPGSQFTPKPFMPQSMMFQPHTQFGQQASAPLNISQHGQMYGQMPGGPNMAQPPQQPAQPQQLRNTPSPYQLGGSSGFMPQFQNPFGPQQTPVGPRMYGPGPMQQPTFDQRTQPQNAPLNAGIQSLVDSGVVRS